MAPCFKVSVECANLDCCLLEQGGLPGSFGDFRRESITRLQKLLLDAAPNGAEPGQKRSKEDEHDQIRNIGPSNVETVERLCKEVCEGQTRERKGENARRWARIPRTDGDGEQEEGEAHVADVVPVQQKRRAERNGNGHNGKAIALHRRRALQQFGRPLHQREYGDDFSVKIPGEIDVQRVRRILEELRRRLADPQRPQIELDYLERLLKDY